MVSDVAEAAAAAHDRDPEAAGDGHHGDDREPPDPVVRQPGEHPEEGRGERVEGHLPLAAPDGEQQDQAGGDAAGDGDEPGQPADQHADQGARQERPRDEGGRGSVPAFAGPDQTQLSVWLWATRSVT